MIRAIVTEYRLLLLAGVSCVALVAPCAAWAADEAAKPAAKPDGSNTVAEIVVNGQQFTGVATPLKLSTSASSDIAAVTVLSGDDIGRQTLATNVDIFRSVPGVQVGDFGQVGIAQGVSFRGWPGANDSSAVAFFVDGVQRNEASGTGANGYLDINPLFSEVLDQVTVVKGPFDTRYGGDFALAGSFIATTADFKPSSVALSGGSYGRFRGVAILGHQTDQYSIYTAVRYLREDGYQANSDQKQWTTFTKLVIPTDYGKFSFSFQSFNLDHGSPGYLDYLKIKSGLISASSAVNPTDGGAKDQYTFISSYLVGDAERGLDATAYGDTHSRYRYATFTPLPQQLSRNRRNFYGVSVDPHWTLNVGDAFDAIVMGGVSARHDDVDIVREPSINRVAIQTPDPIDLNGYQRAAIGQTLASAYGSVILKHSTWLKLMAGVRYDHIDYDVNNEAYVAASNSFAQKYVTSSVGQFVPKLGIAIQPISEVILFANYGKSFASPDGGREVISNPNLASPTLKTNEVGVTYNAAGGRVHLQLSYYNTLNSDEFIAIGQVVTNQGSSKRSGYDFESSALAVSTDDFKLRVYGNYSHIRARLSTGNGIPGVADWVGSYGLHADYKVGESKENMIRVDLGQQWTGPQALNAFNTSFRSVKFSRVTAKASYEIPAMHNLQLWTEGTYYPGSTLDEFGFILSNRRYVTSEPKTRVNVGVSVNF